MTSFKFLVGMAAAGSLFASSTAAVAATSAVPIAQPSPWAALAVMSQGAPAATLCGSAATTAAQSGGCVLPQVDAPPAVPVEAGPPAPVPVPAVAAPSAFGFSPLLLALAAIAAGIGIYFAVKGGNKSNSPA